MRIQQFLKLFGLTLCILLCQGCSTVNLDPAAVQLIQQHMVSFDHLGRPISPKLDVNGWVVGDHRMNPEHYREHVRLIVENARTFLKGKPMRRKSRRLLVFFHGGLNTYDDSRKRVLKQAAQMMEDDTYPIFIAWNSGLFSSYGDDLIYDDGSVSGLKVAMAPLAFVRDIVVGVLNIPARAARFVGRKIGFASTSKDRAAASVAEGLMGFYRSGQNPEDTNQLAKADDPRIDGDPRIDLDDMPQFEPRGFKDYYHYSKWSPSILTLPVSTTTSFMLDAFGKGAWSGMIRRIKRLFDDEDLNHIGRKDSTRGLSLLMHELEILQASLRVNESGQLIDNSSQRGFMILRDGLSRLATKIQDPRYVRRMVKILDALRSPEIRSQLLKAIEPAGTIGSGDIQPLLNQIVSLMYPAKATELGAAGDAIVQALNEAWQDPRARGRLNQFFAADNEAIDDDALRRLAHELLDYTEQRITEHEREELEVSIFAHSMGTIIVNEILRRSQWFSTPRFSEIVYMGAACKIRDYEDSVFPYLFRNRPFYSQFYNLMLHPMAEREENMFYEIIPRGSLLVYVDDYLSSPSTIRDKTLGRFHNIMLSLDRTQTEIADRIHMKVFSAGHGAENRDDPEAHTEFTSAPFWKSSFYKTRRQIEWEKVDAELRAAPESEKNPTGPSKLKPRRRGFTSQQAKK